MQKSGERVTTAGMAMAAQPAIRVGLPGAVRSVLVWRLLLAGLLTPVSLGIAPVYALGLGPAQLESHLGEAFRMRVPVNAADYEDVSCVLATRGTDDLPSPVNPRVAVESSGQGTYLEVSTTQIVNDPAISITVAVGCGAAVSRHFVFFLDPPTANPTVVGAGSLPLADGTAPVVSTLPARTRRPRHGVPTDSATTNGSGAADSADGSAARSRPARVAAPSAVAPTLPRRQMTSSLAPATALHGRPAASAGGGDRIRISDELDSPTLRISSDLLPNADVAPMDAARLQMLRDERARLMAVLGGLDPDSVPTAHELELQKRVADLSTDINAMRQQVKTLTDRNQVLEKTTLPQILTWVFGLIALVSLLLVGWFGWRFKVIRREALEHPWWEQNQPPVEPAEDGGAPMAPIGRAVGRVSADDGMTVVEEDSESNQFNEALASVSAATIAHQAVTAAPAPITAESLAVAAATTMPVPVVPPVRATAAKALPPVEYAPSATIPVTVQAVRDAKAAAFDQTVNLNKVTPVAPSAPNKYAESKSVSGSLDERVDSGDQTPPRIDFNLDLPAVTTNLGRDDRGVASAGDEMPTQFGPLDFEIPSTNAPALSLEPESEAPRMGPDTILRLDDAASASPVAATAHESDDGAEQASAQFRLIQFASVVEQADELMRVNELTKAIALLRQYVLRDETIPTLMWLMLFDLYKQVNKQPVYEALSEHFSRRYKRPMVKWDETLADRTPQTPLAELTEMDQSVRAQWGTQAGFELLRSLTCGRDQDNAVIFNGQLQHDLLKLAKVYPLDDSV